MRNLRHLGAAALAATALAGLPAAAPANVQVGSSGWQWGNPVPQGNTLRAFAFFPGGVGYAAGDFGTLLRTDDAGATWTGLPAGTFSGLHEVQAVDADTMIAGGGCVARRTDDAGRTFRRIPFTPVESSCREGLAALHFTAEQTGYLALGDGTVLRTADGGSSFEQKRAVPSTRAQLGAAAPSDLFFTTDTTGFATTTDGKIYRTTDGANSWALVSETTRAVRSITFVDANTGFAVGDASLFLRTTDGGATWTPRDVGGAAPQNLIQVRCATTTLCVAATERGDVLVRTADGGDTFAFVTPSSDKIFGVGFASATRLVAGGEFGTTVVSDDGGLNFTPIGGRLPGMFNRVRAGLQGNTAFAGGADGALARTVDGGRTWTRSNVSTSEDVVDVSFPSADVGFALDSAGGLFATGNGGTAWRTLDTGTTAEPKAVYATSTSTLLLVGPTGIRRSTDAGTTFSTNRSRAVARTSLEDIDRAGSTLFAFGVRDIARSTNNGVSWTTVRKPGRPTRRGGRLTNRLGMRDVDFVNARVGFVLDAQGRVHRTRNGGRTWTELPGVGTTVGYDIAFSSPANGYLAINEFGDVGPSSGFLLRTEDGGSTWHPQFVISTEVRSLAAPGGGTDYLLGGTSSLLFTPVGGDVGARSTLTVTTQRRRLSRGGRIRVTGRLSPASGNERVTVAYRRKGTTTWRTQTVRTASSGTFTTSWNIGRGSHQFVAQWQGDFRSQGDGSPTLDVRVGRRR